MLVFLKQEMNRLKPEIPKAQERFCKATQMWTSLSIKEKKMYSEIAKERKLTYNKELNKWFQVIVVYFVKSVKCVGLQLIEY